MTPYFHSISAFFHMGGYADYVWPAYALVFVVLVSLLLHAKRGLKKQFQRIQRSIEC